MFSCCFSGLLTVSIYIMHSALLLLWALGNTRIASFVLNLPPALTTPTISPPVLLLSNASSLTPSMLNNLTQSIPVSTSISYDCDKENFGSPSFDSCTNAYQQMAPGRHARSYGDRENQQTYDFPLPLRYASGKWESLDECEKFAASS